MDNKIIDNEPMCQDLTDKVLTESEARDLSQLSHKKPKADKDLLHDMDKLKVMPPDDGSLAILSNKRKRVRRTTKLEPIL